MNRVPMLMPSAPRASAATRPRPSAKPPEAIIGMSILAAAAGIKTRPGMSSSPGCPAHSKPSMLMPSTPRLCALTAWRTEVHLCSTLMPLSWNIGRCGAGLEPAVSTILMPASTITCRYSSYGGGLMVGRMVRFTPNGLSGRSRHLAISRARSAGVGCVSAVMKPSAPEFATAATSSARPTHCMPPCTTGCSTPNVSVNFVRIVIGAALSSRKRSWGRHPDPPVQPNHFAVEHRVLHDVHGQRPVFVGITQPRRMRYLLAQRFLGLLGQRTKQRRLEQARRDGAHTDQLARQVAGDRQRHADD